MKTNKWFKIWSFSIFTLASLAFTLNLIVDPLSLTQHNILNIKKIVQAPRISKLNELKKINNLHNLILGSSRARRINPDLVTKLLGGKTYNASMSTGLIEDYLGYILFLQKNNKLPKNIILALDFYTLNNQLPSDKHFLTSKELNFISNEQQSWLDFLSLDMLNLSIQNLSKYQVVPSKTHISNGFTLLDSKEKLIKKGTYNFKKRIEDDSFSYMKNKYSYNTYSKISEKRLSYLHKIIDISKNNSINLYIFLTPVQSYHLQKINENTVLKNTLQTFKHVLAKETSYYDFMYNTQENANIYNFYDAVHYRDELAKIITKKILTNDLNNSYGIYVKKL